MATTAANCTRASAVAEARSPRNTAWRQTSVSSVARVGPPSTSTTPNDVKQNRNTIDDAAATAGHSRGHVTHRKAWAGDAPRTRACSTARGSSPSQKVPTVRSTTATLKNTWAARIAPAVRVRRNGPSSSPRRSNRAKNAPPTTTVGSTNGTVAAARSNDRPRNRRRASRWAPGRATATVSTVEATACHRVNQATPRNDDRPGNSTSRFRPSAPSPRTRIDPTGYKKKTPRKAAGTTTATAASTLRREITEERSPSSVRTSRCDGPRCRRDPARADRRPVQRNPRRSAAVRRWPEPGRRTCSAGCPPGR